MRKLFAASSVVLAGLATSLLTAAIVTVINLLTDFNLFTLSMWVIVPVGAGLCGFFAASGYYLAAKWLHQRPTKVLLLQMVAIALATQLLIYWLEYQTLTIDGQRIAEFVPFLTYLNVSLTTSHVQINAGAGVDTGAVGSFGYWIAAIELLGFLVGGLIVYLLLAGLPSCSACSKYLRKEVSKEDSFAGLDEFAPYYDQVYAYPVDSAEFARHIGTSHSVDQTERGTIGLTTSLFECPQCDDQYLLEKVRIHDGKDWKEVAEWKRYVAMPKGIDVRSAFV